MSVVIGFSVL